MANHYVVNIDGWYNLSVCNCESPDRNHCGDEEVFETFTKAKSWARKDIQYKLSGLRSDLRMLRRSRLADLETHNDFVDGVE